MGIKAMEKKNRWGTPARPGFISASLLTLLLCTLVAGLSIGKAMQVTVERTKHTLDAIQAGLAFERIMLEADLGLAVQPFQSGSFSVNIEETPAADGGRLIRVYLTDQSQLKEEVWLNSAVSY